MALGTTLLSRHCRPGRQLQRHFTALEDTVVSLAARSFQPFPTSRGLAFFEVGARVRAHQSMDGQLADTTTVPRVGSPQPVSFEWLGEEICKAQAKAKLQRASKLGGYREWSPME